MVIINYLYTSYKFDVFYLCDVSICMAILPYINHILHEINRRYLQPI